MIKATVICDSCGVEVIFCYTEELKKGIIESPAKDWIFEFKQYARTKHFCCQECTGQNG